MIIKFTIIFALLKGRYNEAKNIKFCFVEFYLYKFIIKFITKFFSVKIVDLKNDNNKFEINIICSCNNFFYKSM